MEIKEMEIEKLLPAAYNPRVDLTSEDQEYQDIKRSIEKFGYIETIVWNKQTGRLITGHQRVKILKEKGVKKEKISIVDFDEQTEKEANLALNKVEGRSEPVKLFELITELEKKGSKLEDSGFHRADIDEVISAVQKKSALDKINEMIGRDDAAKVPDVMYVSLSFPVSKKQRQEILTRLNEIIKAEEGIDNLVSALLWLCRNAKGVEK